MPNSSSSPAGRAGGERHRLADLAVGGDLDEGAVGVVEPQLADEAGGRPPDLDGDLAPGREQPAVMTIR
jgi:hypothetical protein